MSLKDRQGHLNSGYAITPGSQLSEPYFFFRAFSFPSSVLLCPSDDHGGRMSLMTTTIVMIGDHHNHGDDAEADAF